VLPGHQLTGPSEEEEEEEEPLLTTAATAQPVTAHSSYKQYLPRVKHCLPLRDFKLGFLTHEDGTDWLSRNVGTELALPAAQFSQRFLDKIQSANDVQ
jgi:hypothetical protein